MGFYRRRRGLFGALIRSNNLANNLLFDNPYLFEFRAHENL